MCKLPITRAMEHEFPEFNSHKEASAFFYKKYGKDFILEAVEQVGDMNCYFHALVTDWDSYTKGRELLLSRNPMSGDFASDFLFSSQPIQIMEDGSVHIVY